MFNQNLTEEKILLFLSKRYRDFKYKTGYSIYLGFELEFYASPLRDNMIDVPSLDSTSILDKSLNYIIKKESGKYQHEIISKEPIELPEAVQAICYTKEKLIHWGEKNDIQISFSSRIDNGFIPNSLHISISLHRENKLPLFKKITFRPPQEHILFNCINGLCETLPESLVFFLGKNLSIDRFNYMSNSDLFPRGFIPTNLSWGVNNRTTALRVCRSTFFTNTFRIEHRVPCADCNPILATIVILVGLEYGINRLPSTPILNQCFGISQTQGLQKLWNFPSSSLEILNIFEKGTILRTLELFDRN